MTTPAPLKAVALVLLLVGCGGGAGESVTLADGGADAATPDATLPDAALPDALPPDAAPPARFSFFVTSLRALQELSGSEQGFGGDLRFGETGPGAGLRGADRICAAIAERSMPGAGGKPWRAFLSATDGGDGRPVDAIDRVGDGPWYDRLGRLVADGRDDLLATRPNADAAIRDDLPNEDGVPNHRPDPTRPEADNHDTLTGSDATGHLFGPTSTCLDWTSNTGDVAAEGRPHCGHSWPRYGRPGGRPPPGGMGGFGDPASWISALDESGCAPGVNIIETGPPMRDAVTVGSGGGYGGFYCFSLVP